MVTTELRHAEFEDILDVLRTNQDAKVDAVVPASHIESVDGVLHVAGLAAGTVPDTIDELMAQGIDDGDALIRPTEHMDAQIAEKLKIGLPYLRRMRAEATDLYDANVNGWLHGFRTTEGVEPCENDPRYRAPDGRSFMVRSFANWDQEVNGGLWVGRALMSNKVMLIDDLDLITAALSGARSTGHELAIVGGDMSPTRTMLKVACPELKAFAPKLLDAYRPVHRGRATEGQPGYDFGYGHIDDPVVFAGFEVVNSEVGASAAVIQFRMVVLKCMNGLKTDLGAEGMFRRVHLGARLDEGRVIWSDDTKRKNLEVITAQAADTIRTFLSQDFLDRAIADIEERAGTEVTDVEETVKVVSNALGFDDSVRKMVFDHFIRGGQLTAGGMVNAITSVAQVVSSADVAFEMENQALRALELITA